MVHDRGTGAGYLMSAHPKNLAALEQLLTDARDKYPATAEAMSEAVRICQSRHAVHGGINFNLRVALASLRAGRTDDATRYIQIALDIEDRWNSTA